MKKMLLFIGVTALGVAVWRRFRSPDASGDVVPKDPRPQQTLVDRASESSFPASDPPSYWARDAG
jgi:hypothetical protein